MASIVKYGKIVLKVKYENMVSIVKYGKIAFIVECYID